MKSGSNSCVLLGMRLNCPTLNPLRNLAPNSVEIRALRFTVITFLLIDDLIPSPSPKVSEGYTCYSIY